MEKILPKGRISVDHKFEGNPRTITEETTEKLRLSMKKFGDLSGIVYCQKNKAYVGGNQRSGILDGCEITITERYDTPERDKTMAIGYITNGKSRYHYREVYFTRSMFEEACLKANSLKGDFDWAILADWDQDTVEEAGLPRWEPLDEDIEKNHSEKNVVWILKVHFDSKAHCQEIEGDMQSKGLTCKMVEALI